MTFTQIRQAAAYVLTVCVLLSATICFAQGSGTCTVTGVVYDASGAVVPGAKVQLILQTSKAVRQTEANGVGFFSFVGVPAGTYDVRVDSQGFAPFLQTGLVLHINDQVDLKKMGSDPALQLAISDFGAPPVNVDTAGVMTNKFGHRTMQLALKFYF